MRWFLSKCDIKAKIEKGKVKKVEKENEKRVIETKMVSKIFTISFNIFLNESS